MATLPNWRGWCGPPPQVAAADTAFESEAADDPFALGLAEGQRLAEAAFAVERQRLLALAASAEVAPWWWLLAGVAAARQAFGGGNDWSAVPEHRLEQAELRLVDLVTLPGVDGFKSRREAKQCIEQGAVKINGEPCLDPARTLTAADCDGEYLRLQAGKKTRVRVYFPR